MADEEDRRARWRVMLPRDPKSTDVLQMEIHFLDIHAWIKWPDSKRDELVNLGKNLKIFADRAHLEFETHRGSTEIDSDLSLLFEADE